MTREELKELIDEEIKENGQGEITGPVLNNVLQRMLETLPGQRNPETNSELFNSDFNTAMGENSHAEGLGTKAVSDASHAEGKYNKGYSGAIHEVGIGTNNSTRRDAHVITVDGKHYVLGLGGFNTGNEDLADCEDLAIVVNNRVTTEQMTAAILVEKQRAEAKERELQEAIDREVSRASTAESELHNEVLTEQGRAEDAEAELSARIDAIVQGRDVRDIVPNYQALLDYDTTALGDNDIIMVLLDNTKSDHTTYYRWHTDTQSWEFIGGLAFTYTKTEIDQKFADLHIVLPVFNEQSSQELLAQVDETIRHAGDDAQFKLPIPVEGMSGNVTVTYVKFNPMHTYLGVFADDRSELYHITRTLTSPRTYTCEVITKVFASKYDLSDLINSLYNDDPEEGELGDIVKLNKALEEKEDKAIVLYYCDNTSPQSRLADTFNKIKDNADSFVRFIYEVRPTYFLAVNLARYYDAVGHSQIEFHDRVFEEGVWHDYNTTIGIVKEGENYLYWRNREEIALKSDLEGKQDADKLQTTITESDTNYPSSKAVITYVGQQAVFERGTGTNSVVQKGLNNVASGVASMAVGYNNIASGLRSHAEGNRTRAGLETLPTEDVTSTDGIYTHAEGNSTLARGSAAHAEGAGTQSLGRASHAEGRHSIASGNYAHAEGFDTFAGDNGGQRTSTSESDKIGFFTHAEGHNTLAEGNSSHAEGKKSRALGLASHAEGGALAKGRYSHAEGLGSNAEGNQSHTEGFYTHSIGDTSHAEGNTTISQGTSSHAEGSHTLAQGVNSHAEGAYNIGYTDSIHEVGIGNSSQRKNAHTITGDGKHYIPNIGGYQGTETSLINVKDLATVINSHDSAILTDKLTLKAGTFDTNKAVYDLLTATPHLAKLVVYLNTATDTYYHLNTWKKDGDVFRFSYLREDGDNLVVTRFSLDSTGKVS